MRWPNCRGSKHDDRVAGNKAVEYPDMTTSRDGLADKLDDPAISKTGRPNIKPWRSVAKAISWRTVGTIDTLILSYVLITYLGPIFEIGRAHV